MNLSIWFQNNYIEIFGAVTGIIYVFLEIRQNIWLWPLGIITSAVYIWVFFENKFYADMSLQVYYLVISVLGWYWWRNEGRGIREIVAKGEKEGRSEETNAKSKDELQVTKLKLKTGIILSAGFIFLFAVMRLGLSKFTDSPVPGWDSFITSVSIVATWMLARKIYEHWYLWIVVNFISALLFFTRGLYPTVILYIIYGIMSFAGLVTWKKGMRHEPKMVRNV